jgi:putative ABC transport system permease protein
MLLMSMAWRNLWRNRRRSLIAIAAVVFAMFLSIVQMGIEDGTHAVSIRTAVRLSTGFIQIQKIGYNKAPTLQKCFTIDPQIEEALKSDPRITGSSPRIQSDGLLSFADHSVGAMIMGVSPGTERAITDFPGRINSGRFLTDGSNPEIVVGYKLLQNLGAKVGDSVVVLAQGFDGVLGNMFVRIVGTFKTGAEEFDRMGTFMNIASLQNFLGMSTEAIGSDRVNTIAISVKDPADVEDVVNELNPILKPMGLVALPWQTLLPQLEQTMEFDHAGNVFFIIILLVVVGFGILNTVLMSITERFREYGVMLALGMKHENLALAVFIEVFFMLLIGFFFGNLLGLGINYYFVAHPITLGGDMAKLYLEYGFAPIIPSSVAFRIFVQSTVIILAISIAATVYPLWRVVRLEPLKGIRYT